jgi:putative two-component system response regulator
MIQAPSVVSRVLVVDDEPANRDLLSILLTGEGLVVEAVADGETALASVVLQPPDLVLLDVNMPGLDGFAVCRALKGDPSTRLIPIILLTGMNDRARRIQGLDSGADDFLGKPFDVEELRARVRSLVRLKRYTDELESAESVIRSLALTVEARDRYTAGHCTRLARYAVLLGGAIDLTVEQARALDKGGYLHDVGKIGIPDALLNKAARLTAEEFALMQQHTVIGERLCRDMRSLALVCPIIRHHHEWRDGSGYPDGLKGDQVPLLAEIVGIADTFDAVTTDRPYRRARSQDVAFQELARDAARGRWQIELVDTFIGLGRRGLLAPPSSRAAG